MDFKIASTGSLIKEYLEVNGVTQRELALKTGYSEKQVSLILKGKAKLTPAFAAVLSEITKGFSAEYWLAYDSKYQLQLYQEKQKLGSLDYKKWDSTFHLDKTFAHMDLDPLEQITTLQKSLHINEPSEYTYGNLYRQAFLQAKTKNPVQANEIAEIWVQVLLYTYGIDHDEILDYSYDQLLQNLPLLKKLSLAVEAPLIERNISYFCTLVGINLAFEKSAPSSGVCGVTVNDDGKIYLFLTDRFNSVENLWFCFLHELMHLKNHDLDAPNQYHLVDEDLDKEEKASIDAFEFFFPQKDYQVFLVEFKNSSVPTEIISKYAKIEKLTTGMLVNILHHKGDLPYNQCWQLLHRFSLSESSEE